MSTTLRVVRDEPSLPPDPILYTDELSTVNAVLSTFLQRVDPDVRQRNGKPWPRNSIIEVVMAGLPDPDSREGRRLTRAVTQALRDVLPEAAVDLRDDRIRILPSRCHPDAPSANDLQVT